MPSAKEVLRRMVAELNGESAWPSEATWNDARAVLGLPKVPRADAGAMVSAIGTIAGPPRAFAPPALLTEGYGVKVRKVEVRCDDGISMIDEWQVWSITPPTMVRGGLCPKTGRALAPKRRAWGIHRRFDRQSKAEDFAADLRAQRKASGDWPE